MDPSPPAETFRSLLLRHRGRTGLTQRAMAARLSAGRRTIQDWEAGTNHPGAEGLQALIVALLEADGLTAGFERDEARALWAAVLRETARMRVPFDEAWLDGLLAARAAPPSVPLDDALQTASVDERGEDWGEAPDVLGFVGRTEQLTLLRRWVLEDRSRLVALLGFGGIGKTMLAARLAQQVAPSFERVYWRSLRNAPPVEEWLAGAIGFLSDQQLVPPPSEADRITALLQLLRARRCLLVLDNSETLLEPGERQGRYRGGMDGYGRVLQSVGETSHQSCLVLTSREAPPELALLDGGARALELRGLALVDAQAVLADKQLRGEEQVWLSLVDRYGGNGLALKIVGETIRQVFDGDIGAFLADAIGRYGTVFGGIRRLLDVQVGRLSAIEDDLLTRLAIEREPISLAELATDLAPSVGRSAVVEAIETLRRRSLLERGERGATFTLQSMVLEYVTDRLVETAAEEIRVGPPVVVIEQPLIKAQAKEYVRQMQERLIGMPILERLNDAEAGAASRLLALLDGWRARPSAEQGYGPGNAVNLLRLLRGDLRDMDLSRLHLRQLYLQKVSLQDASLANARIVEAVIDEDFAYPSAVALSADGALLAAGTPSGEVRVWRTADRTLLLTAHGHTGMVWSVAVSPDGRLAASGGDDGTVRLWEIVTGQVLAVLHGHTGAVRSVALSGRNVASGGVDGTVRLWNGETEELVVTLQPDAGAVLAVALSGDARLLASGGVDGLVRLWETTTRQSLATLEGHSAGIRGLVFSNDGRLLASGSDDGTIRLWDSGSCGQVGILRGHIGEVWGVALSADGRLLASGGPDGMVRLWETADGHLLGTTAAHAGGVWSVAVSGDGRLVASASWDGTVRLWDTGSRQPVAIFQGDARAVRGVALARDRELVACAGADGMVRLWETTRGHRLAVLRGHTGAVWGVALSGDGRIVASAGWDRTVRLWEAEIGRPMSTLEGHVGVVLGVALSWDGQLVASCGVDGTVRLWQASSGRQLAIMNGHTGAVWCVALSSDGRLVASGGVDRTVRLWDVATGQPLATMEAQGLTYGVGLSEDGRVVASAGADRTVRLWDVANGQPLVALLGHTGPVYGIAVSANGGLVASGGEDRTVRVWDAMSQQALATLRGHTGLVWSVGLSADGRLIASGSDDGTVRLWDAVRGTALRTLRSDRPYERLDITGLTGVTSAQRAALLALGAIERAPAGSGIQPMA
jgi:WD40 repeat protein